MRASAAVMTGKGTGAVATIQVCGDSAKGVINKIFKPTSERSAEFEPGKICIGTIIEAGETIDQVTIGCEGPDRFAINCHGNPLIVERIMQLLKYHGVELSTAEQLFCETSAESSTIAFEAKLILPKVKTIEGTQIILNQIDSGLTAVARKWLESPIDKIRGEAKDIIEASKIAKLIIFGCRVVITGPPNTGKSTLLNQLCGREKAIVADIRGTTRDWVSGDCRIGSLAVELIDTAGLDEQLADDINKAAQQAAVELINQADLVLLVLDISEPAAQLTKSLANKLANRKTLTVLNKSDLPARFDPTKLRGGLANAVTISAKFGMGMEALGKRICETTGGNDFDLGQAVCFTGRQERLVAQLAEAKSRDTARATITELLSGRVDV